MVAMMRKQQGFTLIELLVVVSLLAVVSAAAVLAMPSPARKQLEEEALRMATLMEIARAQSRASGLPVYLHVQEQGFEFEGSSVVRKLSSRWLYENTSANKQLLQLGPEPVIAAQTLRLAGAGGQQVVLQTDGVSPFDVQAP